MQDPAHTTHLRNVLHDSPDAECVQILQAIIPAMSKDSAIQINEMIISTRACTTGSQTQMDIVMMSVVSGAERTEGEWRAILESAGLKVRSICRYT